MLGGADAFHRKRRMAQQPSRLDLPPTLRPEPRTDPAKQCDRAEQQRPQLSIVPNVPGSPPLELGVYQRFVLLHFAAGAKLGCQRCKHMRPNLVLQV